MLNSYFAIAWRNLLRNKIHSAINITGLAVGVASCLVLYLIVSYELSFNKEMIDYDRIFRIHSSFSGNMAMLDKGVPTAIAPAVRENFSGVESVVLGQEFQTTVLVPAPEGRRKFDNQSNVVTTEPSYFSVFGSYEWIAGSPQVLAKPFQVVLTESKAKLYFNSSDPAIVLGKEIIYQDSLSTHVAGIVKDLPFVTDIDFTDFISLETNRVSFLKNSFQLENWDSSNSATFTFLKTSLGTPRSQIENQIEILNQQKAKERKNDGFENNFKLDSFSNLHFNSKIGIFEHSREAAHLPTLIILIVVSVVLLLIAAINFINLETARVATRSKEVGVRKVMGSLRYQLVFQFLIESLIVTLFAVALSLPIAEFAFNYFSEFIPSGLSIYFIQTFPFLVLVIVSVGLLAGLYPAWTLSSFKPVLALKTKSYLLANEHGIVPIRKMLIVLQFASAQVFICAALIFASQMRFLLNRDLGFRTDAVIYVFSPWQENKSKIQLLKNELIKIPEITDLCLSAQPPSANMWATSAVNYKNKKEIMHIEAFRKFGDHHYMGFYEMKLLAGRNLQPSDTVKEVIINETMMHQMDIQNPTEAIGKIIDVNKHHWPIIGVAKDFNVLSLHNPMRAVMIASEENNFSCFNVRLATKNRHSDQLKIALSKMEASWKKIYPDYPFDFRFLDETIRNFYQGEQRSFKLINAATVLAILISCLGLFGLSSYTVVQRTKEIGIRKVLGASVTNIASMLSREFVVLVVIAFLIAMPLAWYAAKEWLQTYPYHMDLSAILFILTLFAAIFLAMITVSFQVLKTANSNPVDSLKSE